MKLRAPARAVSLALLLILAPGVALAVDPAAFAAKIEAQIRSDNARIVLGAATETADGLEFPNAQISWSADGDEGEVPVPLTFSGITELPDGGYTVELVTMPDIEQTDGDLTVTVNDIRLERLNVPSDPAIPFVEGMYRDSFGSVGPIRFEIDGEEAVRIGAITMSGTIEGGSDGTTLRSEGQYAIDDVSVDFGVSPTPELEAFTSAFGQSLFTGRMSGSAVLDTSEARFALERQVLTLDGLGEFTFDATTGGWTPGFLTEIQKSLAAVQALEDAGGSAEDVSKAQTALGMQVLALTLISGGFSYDDRGLTDKLLALTAESEKTTRPRLVARLNEGISEGLEEMGLGELAGRISREAARFLANPGSFDIGFQPPSPVPLILLSAAAVQPSLIVTMLNLSVEANARVAAEPRPDRAERGVRADDAAPRGIPRAPRN